MIKERRENNLEWIVKLYQLISKSQLNYLVII